MPTSGSARSTGSSAPTLDARRRSRRLIGPIGYDGASAVDGDDDVLTVQLPSWRPDSTAEIDVVEEVARHYGYDNLGKTVPKSTTATARLSPLQQRRRALRQVLLGLGLDEAITDTFLSAATTSAARLAGRRDPRHEPARRRRGRAPSVDAARAAARRSRSTSRTGAPASRCSRSATSTRPATARPSCPPSTRGSRSRSPASEAPAAMAVWRELAAAMGFGARVDQSHGAGRLHPTRSATLSLGRDVVGAVGEIHPDVLDAFGVTERVAWLELDLTRLLATEPKVAAVEADQSLPVDRLRPRLRRARRGAGREGRQGDPSGGGRLLVDLALFDVFRGPGVDRGPRSLAYRLRLQAPDRTLTDAEVADVARQDRRGHREARRHPARR